jgi:HSP20 family molecular chaperone IbpA
MGDRHAERASFSEALACRLAFDNPCWQPSVDVYHGAEEWLLKFDLAGVAEGDFDVEIGSSAVVVQGRRRDRLVLPGRRTYRMEIAYNQFARTVALPVELDPASCRWTYRDGMLVVTVRPRREGGG